MQDLMTVGEQTLHYLRRPHAEMPTHAIESPAAWRARDLAEHPEDWTIELDGAQIDQLERAYESARQRPMDRIDRSNFPLPGLAAEIDR